MQIQDSDIDDDLPIEIVGGRPLSPDAPSFDMPHWVLCSGLSAQSKAVYAFLAIHAQEQSDGKARVELSDLIRYLGPDGHLAAKALEDLTQLGAIGYDDPGQYVVHSNAPEGYAGPLTYSDYLASLGMDRD